MNCINSDTFTSAPKIQCDRSKNRCHQTPAHVSIESEASITIQTRRWIRHQSTAEAQVRTRKTCGQQCRMKLNGYIDSVAEGDMHNKTIYLDPGHPSHSITVLFIDWIYSSTKERHTVEKACDLLTSPGFHLVCHSSFPSPSLLYTCLNFLIRASHLKFLLFCCCSWSALRLQMLRVFRYRHPAWKLFQETRPSCCRLLSLDICRKPLIQTNWSHRWEFYILFSGWKSILHCSRIRNTKPIYKQFLICLWVTL